MEYFILGCIVGFVTTIMIAFMKAYRKIMDEDKGGWFIYAKTGLFYQQVSPKFDSAHDAFVYMSDMFEAYNNSNIKIKLKIRRK